MSAATSAPNRWRACNDWPCVSGWLLPARLRGGDSGGAGGAAVRRDRRVDAAAARPDARPRSRKPLDRAFAVRQGAGGGAADQFARRLAGAVASDLPRIRQLADEKNIPVLAFIEDVGASGGYMIACAADEIICDVSIRSSVRSAWSAARSGFRKLLEKLGIERRLYTSGERKAMLDPFLPEKPEDVEAHRSAAARTFTSTSSRW